MPISRPRSSRGIGLASSMPGSAYEQRTKPVRNRTKSTTAKVKPPRPPAHRVGRSKR